MAERTVPLFCATWLLEPGTPLECCRQAKAAGFDGVSFAVGRMDDPRRLDRLSPREAAELRMVLVELGLDPSLHDAMGLPLPSSGFVLSCYRRHFAAYLTAARKERARELSRARVIQTAIVLA